MEDLKKLLPDGVFSTIGKVFDLVKIAEEEIEDAVAKHPDKTKELRDAFQEHLFPGDLARFGERIYRAHAREILTRISEGTDPTLGTLAECLVTLSLASLKAPLTSGHLAAMEKAFKHVFPERDEANVGREAWPGETDEILNDIRRKIARRR